MNDDADRTWSDRRRDQPPETIHDRRTRGEPADPSATVDDSRGNGGPSGPSMGARPDETVVDGSRAGANRDGGERPPLSIVVPSPLPERFQVVEELSQGAEGTVLLVVEVTTGQRRILKLYRRDVGLDTEAVETLRRISGDPEGRRHVVNLFEAARAEGGQWYEVQEYCPGGSLYDLLAEQVEVDVRRVVERVGRALVYLEGRLHLRDVKPANLLVRSRDDLEIVPGDFGLARSTRDGANRFTRHAGTPLYLPPEATENRLTSGWDWWSFGIVIAELALRRHPLAFPDGRSPAPEYIPALVREHAVDVSGIADERLRNLCRGLLVRDYRQRWRGEQVQRWLNGEDPEVPRNDALVVDTAPAAEAEAEAHVQFAGEIHRAPLPLARAFQRQWRYAVERLFVLRDPEWVGSVEGLLRECGLLGAAQTVKQGLSRGATTSSALAMLLLEMSPDIPPVFDGMSLTPDGLRDAAKDVLVGRRTGTRLDEVRKAGILVRWRSLAGIAGADRLTEPWAAGAERIEQLVDLVNARESQLDRAAADRAKAWLLLSLLGRSYEDDLLAEVRQAAQGSAANTPWWQMLAAQATDGRAPSLPAAALAAVTHPQAAFLAEELEFRDAIGERADLVLQREQDELDLLRQRDADPLGAPRGILTRLFPRFRRRFRAWFVPAGAFRPKDLPLVPAWLVTVPASVLVGWHLWLLVQYEDQLRLLFTDPELPEPGMFRQALATLDGLTRRVELMSAIVVTALVANVGGLLLARRRGARSRAASMRPYVAGAAVLQVVLLSAVAYSGLIHLVLGQAANGYERAGFAGGFLPQWARASGLLFAVIVTVTLLALVIVGARSWRSLSRGERYF